MPARSPLVQNLLDTIVPSVARWLVGRMRRLEEADLSSAARWELLRVALEQIARGPGR
jgi:hypothetical protein